MSTLTLRNVKGTPLTNTEVDDNFSNLNTDKLEKDGSNSMTGKLTTVTSSASTASVRVVAGSADPTSPVSGDFWNNAGNFKFYTGTTTRVLATLDGAQTLTNKIVDAAIVTNGLFFEGATDDAFETLLTVVDPTADRTVTIPDATTTMVGTDVAQTLTNKTVDLTNNTLIATSAQMLAAVTDETGTGSLVFANTPTLITPVIAEIDATVDFTIDAGGDIILDADDGDIILKDGTVEFGRLNNNSGQLRIATGSPSTNSLSLSGADVTVAGDLQVTGNDIKMSGGTTALTFSGSGDVAVAGDLQVTGNDIKSSTGAVVLSLSGTDVTVAGNLTVSGSTTTVNSATLDVVDKNITIAKGNATNAGADGAGITVEATTASAKTFTYNNGNDSWTSSENMNVAAGKQYRVGGTQIAASNLSNGTTGSGSVVLSTSPSLTTPVLGTPSSGTLTNCTGLPNGGLLNSSVTVTAGTGMSGGGSVALGSSVTLTNAGVTSAVAGTGVTVSGATGAVTFSIGQAVATGSNVQFNSIGVGTAGSGTTGEIRATNEITAFFSDARLKNFHGTIPNALEKVTSLNGYYFTENEVAKSLGYNNDKMQIGVSAQEVQAVFPEAVAPAPIDEQYLTVKYEKLVPALVEAIKALKLELDEVKKNCNCNK
jgi:hypothetical protein